MANSQGHHTYWTQGGKYAKNKNLSIDFSQFEELGERLDRLGVDAWRVVDTAMTKAGQKVQKDVLEAVEKANLPAKGIYSQGDTEKSIIQNPRPDWSGYIGEMKLGFDYSKLGAGGLLITGTPTMQPDQKLAKIFQSKSYKKNIERQIRDSLLDTIEIAKTFGR